MPPPDPLMIDKWKIMRYLEHLLLTFESIWWICRDSLFAKLNAWSLFLSALKIILDYLQNRKQRTKIGSSYIIWEDITFGVPQGSILGPLSLNIFLCDFFLEYGNNYFANYADNTKINTADENAKEVLTNLSALAQKQYTHGWLTIKRKRIMKNVICFWVLKRALTFR